jgi:hypothetical protein
MVELTHSRNLADGPLRVRLIFGRRNRQGGLEHDQGRPIDGPFMGRSRRVQASH